MSVKYSALWSSLRTLELTRQFTSTHVDPPKSYHTSFPGNDLDKKIHKRHQKLATAVALIGASSPDAKTVTACSVEVSYPEGSGIPMVILRIAQNKGVCEAELAMLQKLVNDLVREIKQEASILADKDQRRDAIESITMGFLLPRVVERCRVKISRILNGPYSKPFRDWYADIINSGTTDQDVLECCRTINCCSSDHVSTFKNADEVVESITGAYIIIEGFVDSLEPQWAFYDSKTSRDKVEVSVPETKEEEGVQGEQVDGGQMDREEEDTEDLDDRESLDPEVMKKSSIYRFLLKLSRYHVACSLVTSEVVALVRRDAERNIKVETVPISTTTSMPANENEYPSLDSFFERCVRTDLKLLDPMKINNLRDSWLRDRESKNLFLHAEMQIALFYALNPQLNPIQGFIGVSKKCCWCCDFVLKHLQLPGDHDERYSTDVTGPPLLFSVEGTHNRKYTAWVFPNPATHIQYTSLDDIPFKRVCRRFERVREDLENALVKEVEDIVAQLRKRDHDSDSSGLSGEEGSDYRKTLKRLKANSATRARRKRKSEHTGLDD